MSMKITILGSGTSCGVPLIGCRCSVCTSVDSHDKRLRCSALVETDNTCILIDCGPDFREQMMPLPFHKLDAVLVTHEHYDHVGGIDDLRPFTKIEPVPIYADAHTCDALYNRMPYCFREHLYPGVPKISLHAIEAFHPFDVGDVTVRPLSVMHGHLPILGFRIGKLGYVTDMSSMCDESYEELEGVELLIMNALRIGPHPTHQSLSEAMTAAHRIHAKQTYLIHMSHDIGLHAEVNKKLPQEIQLAYDGLVIEL
jgi:phosphoribosyl 1,2-cyclic phosphate phosphodiesterase